MKNYIVAALMFLLAIPVSYAQSENDKSDYAAVHSTFLPGDGRLKIEEKYDRNASVYFSGDDLVMVSKGEAAMAGFVLPVNPMQDYIVEFALKTNKIGKSSCFTAGIGNIGMTNIGKRLVLAKGEEVIYENSKWETPLYSTEDATIKIERRRKIVTVYVNGRYVCETQVQETFDEMPCLLIFASKAGMAVLRSIRIDQGADE